MTDRNPRVRRALSPKALEEKLCRSKTEIWKLRHFRHGQGPKPG